MIRCRNSVIEELRFSIGVGNDEFGNESSASYWVRLGVLRPSREFQFLPGCPSPLWQMDR